ncbi:uncharacterized protein EI97DRAFT_180179 [Westerdykella ornata]|uniref:Uncharacterized protein n=1 Tax=Westerdykella ornata TaxID=318751 RepID=A0A6A6JSM8_WESOR|nr:uncharacterized protein EI97DRAFT_180179 [Westerdykella ornata]KAF2279562.1 hypothetical protein EI97DRAFT_180179 [Westerdykella ornata]
MPVRQTTHAPTASAAAAFTGFLWFASAALILCCCLIPWPSCCHPFCQSYSSEHAFPSSNRAQESCPGVHCCWSENQLTQLLWYRHPIGWSGAHFPPGYSDRLPRIV